MRWLNVGETGLSCLWSREESGQEKIVVGVEGSNEDVVATRGEEDDDWVKRREEDGPMNHNFTKYFAGQNRRVEDIVDL